MSNPYLLTFGKEPIEHIDRLKEKQTVLDDFLTSVPTQQVYMVTGVRGSGKTVFMTDISQNLKGKSKDWIIVDLNPTAPDLIKEAGAILSSENDLARIFQNARLNLSLFGFGLEVSNSVPISDAQTALEKMLSSLAKKKKKVLFTIDEVTITHAMKAFTFAFQQFLRKNLPVYLLMTGLYKNISDLQNQDNLTFLYRAPQIVLTPLNINAMAVNYEKNIGLSKTDALDMAKLTKGYSFAFQVLGHLLYDANGNYENLIPEFRQYLEDMSYDKIWSELSGKDRQILEALAESESGKNSETMELAGLSDNEFNPYRRRLIKKGVVDGSVRGYLSFTLPFFREFILSRV